MKEKSISTVDRILSNIGGERPAKRKLLKSEQLLEELVKINPKDLPIKSAAQVVREAEIRLAEDLEEMERRAPRVQFPNPKNFYR